jgi:predicted alpha-1,2-mannosidase
MKQLFMGLLLIVVVSCNKPAFNPLEHVDLFLGTGGHGHVHPAATVPFGMVQVGPDNGVDGWDWCSGYHYSSATIAGFSHTHLSGTGIGDGYDISVLPLTNTDSMQEERIHLPFSHENETASPGYYRVQLDNGVNCEMTATERSALHRYQFPTDTGWLRWDPSYHQNWDAVDSAEVWVVNDTIIAGYKHSTGWAKNQRVYFQAVFNQPIKQVAFIGDSTWGVGNELNGTGKKGRSLKLMLQFASAKLLEVRVGISNVSYASAQLSNTENAGRNFESIQTAATSKWTTALSFIRIKTKDEQMMKRFYTAAYRTCMAPSLYSDGEGRYRNADGRLLQMKKNTSKYTIFSTWDTFRALHPLFTLTQPERVAEWMNSLLQFYRDNGRLPVWDISSWDANTMTGFHSVPILADAILKNIKGFDHAEAYAAMKASAEQSIRGTPYFNQYGYLPHDLHGWSVTYTLEYAFDNWCIAQVARKLGFAEEAVRYEQRAENYKNLFDPATGFMRGKLSNGKWVEPFDPYVSEHGFEGQYIEGTAWQHSFFVPHNINGLADLYGGKERLIAKLDTLFTTASVLKGDNVSIDVTGLIGQYAHGNEPSHHIAYMYTALGRPDKAAEWIRVIADSMYKTGPDGLSGNDDCGQMSAWFLFSAMGMYPMNPAAGEYVVGYPLLEEATIQVPGGKSVTIQRKGNGKSVIKIIINGKQQDKWVIQHQQLMQGGTIELHTE